MQPNLKIIGVMLILFNAWMGYLPTYAQPPDSLQQALPGFIDKNNDGINDVFHDKNGDGKNDVTQKQYAHSFAFQDEDNDGINDVWIDCDGDGVNDLMIRLLRKMGKKPQYPWVDRDGDGIRDPGVQPRYDADLRAFVLDENHDDINDITSQQIDKEHVWGYRYGNLDEENDEDMKKFDDDNHDGMHDGFGNRFDQDMKGWRHGKQFDYFIDNDGDGISDERGMGRLGNRRRGQRVGHGKNRK
ncbi:hypothetical protein JW960_05735 [candidate division KSB1 bacterium]|nr:hypothetical protein [candidate division KSB1 bacterium]